MQPSQAEHTTPIAGAATSEEPRAELTVIDGGRAPKPEPDPTSPAAAAAAEVRDASEALDVAPWLLQNTTDLVTSIADAQAYLQSQMDALRPLVDEIKAMRSHLLERMLEEHADRVAHPDYLVAITRAKSKDVRVDVLRRLEGLVPAKELEKGLYLYQPEPTWKTNLTKLKPLAKYGDEVKEILAAGIVEIEGPPRLHIEPLGDDDHDNEVDPGRMEASH